MTRTSNYDLIVVEGSDKVNLLTQMNPNTEKIDEVMKTNEKSGVQVATELLSGTVHAITRTVKSASMFKFTAVSNYTSGDTFTVDGKQVTALLTSGEALGTGAYIIGSEVLCSLKDTLLTVYTQGGTVKIAEDAEKLGGNLPEYYAKQSELDIVKNTADSASSLSRTNSESINKLMNKDFTQLKDLTASTSETTLSDNLSNYEYIIILSYIGYNIYDFTMIPYKYLSAFSGSLINVKDNVLKILSDTKISFTKGSTLNAKIFGYKKII